MQLSIASKVASPTHLVHVNCGDSLCVGEDLLVRLPIEELDPLVPLMDVVRVLPQHHTAQQDGPPLHQMLQPRQPVPDQQMSRQILALKAGTCHSTHLA